jgi:hypothetical protein
MLGRHGRVGGAHLRLVVVEGEPLPVALAPDVEGWQPTSTARSVLVNCVHILPRRAIRQRDRLSIHPQLDKADAAAL